MELYYTTERNIQILIFLLKKNGIRNIVASPGGTNISFVGSVQKDPFFNIISCVDERSAAYMACGMAAELSEPVVLSCTGATASRNYLPALTEAYYRHLPILAVTSSQVESHIGNLYPQAIDRSRIQQDAVVKSVCLSVIKDDDDEWQCELRANEAIIALKKGGGGPVHINLETSFCKDYSTKDIKPCRKIEYITLRDNMPVITYNKIGIFIGSCVEMNECVDAVMDSFCEKYNALIISDHTSNYHGRYKVSAALIFSQEHWRSNYNTFDLMIHIGDISGDYYSLGGIQVSEVWRVSADGKIEDYFHKITKVFAMKIQDFFTMYVSEEMTDVNINQYIGFCKEYKELYHEIDDLPFSNISTAYKLHDKIRENTVMHFGILNSLRAWNMFELPRNVRCYCNVGGFGIDGALSTTVGASIIRPDLIYVCVLGDLAFFYDINVLFNRHVGNNIRILLINNGLGTEFMHYSNASALFGEDTKRYIAADGHNSNISQNLVMVIAQSMGFEYYSASNDCELEAVSEEFLNPNKGKSIILEVFTKEEDESIALKKIRSLKIDPKVELKSGIRGIVGDHTIKRIRTILKM